MDRTTEELNDILREKYNALDDAGVIAISPADLAQATYNEIDPRKVAPVLVRLAAILELRQLARAICRRRHIDSERIAEQGNLFDFQLQPRYPATRIIEGEKEEVYVLRMHLTYKERMENIQRLSREIDAKTVHRDALQAETDLLVRAGKLPEKEEQPVEPC